MPSSAGPSGSMQGELQAVELCSGFGGIGLGLRALGITVGRAYDAWDAAVALYNHNAPGGVASRANLLSPSDRSRIIKECKALGELDLLVAGPPCKGFSRLRNGFHDGRNGHNRVLASLPDYVGLLRPRMVLIENVPDLARHRLGRTLKDFASRLRRPAAGVRYELSVQVYDASTFGTPQARRRLLILAVRAGERFNQLPPSTVDLSPLFAALRHGTEVPASLQKYLSILADPEDRRLNTAWQALSDLPLREAGVESDTARYAHSSRTAFQRWARAGAGSTFSNARTPEVNNTTLARLKHIPAGGCARSIPTEHLNGLSRRYDSAYRRLHPRAPSTALSTRYDCVYHYQRSRSLSVREYARLQGIPDSVSFPSELTSRRNAYEMIGNSVPPQLIQGVLRSVLSR